MILEDIGKQFDALMCITDLKACCRSSDTGGPFSLGNWFLPNGTKVPGAIVDENGTRWDFYRTRNQMVVHMNRRRGGVNGMYRCEIPDALNVTQTIYLGVYNASTGEFTCNQTELLNTLGTNHTDMFLLWTLTYRIAGNF